jgi:hypothetical protein
MPSGNGVRLWALRCLMATCLFGMILGFHFRGLFGVGLGEAIWGISISADPVGVISVSYERFIQSRNGCGDVVTLHSFPFGEVLPNSFQSLLAPQWNILRFGYLFFNNPVLIYNIAILLLFYVNFVISFFFLSRRMKHWYVGFVPAVLITFSAYTYAHSWAHLGLLPVFIFPVFMVLLCDFLQHRKKISAIWLALTSGFALYSSPYYFYFLFCAGVVILGTHAVLFPRLLFKREAVSSLVWLLFLLLVVISPFLSDAFLIDYTPYWSGPDFDRSYGQDLGMLNSFTARPRDYFLLNIHHFLYGDYLTQFITDQTPLRSKYSDELPIYLGIGPLVFVVLCLWAEMVMALPARLRNVLDKSLLGRIANLYSLVRKQHKLLFVAAILVAFMAFFLSMPPRLLIFGYDWRMPNDFIRQVLPFRSYSRFGMVTLVGLAIALGLVIDAMKKPWVWTLILVTLCVFESAPKTYLHPASRNIPYIRFLRERPEKTLIRLERQNRHLQRAIDLEGVLTEKSVLNGTVNDIYGFSDWLFHDNLNWSFNVGHLRDMGIELLLVNGSLTPGPRDRPYLEKLASFTESNVEIWKILPSGDERVASLFKELLVKKEKDPCFVTPKSSVEQVMNAYFQKLKI